MYIHKDGHVYIKVIEISQDEDFYIEYIEKNLVDESAHYTEIKNKQLRLQYLASRYLIAKMLEGQSVCLYKSAFGKLYIKDNKQHISISHCANYVGVIIANVPVGIDIEEDIRDISKIKHKFVNSTDEELIQEPKDLLTIWCSKEVAYKIYEQKEVDFKEHLSIKRIEENSLEALIHIGDYKDVYTLRQILIKNLMIIWGFGKEIVKL